MTELLEELEQTRLLAIDASAIIIDAPELVVKAYRQKIQDYIDDFFNAIDVDPASLDQDKLADFPRIFNNEPFEEAFLFYMELLNIDEETAQAQLDAKPLGFDIKPWGCSRSVKDLATNAMLGLGYAVIQS